MVKKIHNRKRFIPPNKLQFIPVVVAIGIGILVGSIVIQSRAATIAVAAEAESGTKAGNSTIVSDASASGGSSVKFGTAQSGGGSTCSNPQYTIPYSTSDAQTGVSIGNFYITNDTWNNGSGTQTLYVCSPSSWYAMAKQPNDTAVKTYPNVHQDFIDWDTNVSPPLSNYHTITSTFGQTSPHTGIYEWAYDLWFNGVADNTSTEVMIWTENFNQAPGGSKRTTFTDGGQTYDVYSDGTNCAANGCYIAFVPHSTMTSGSVNILNFMNFLINTQHWLNSSTTVGQLDYGVEICSTNNINTRFDLTNFSLTAN